MKVSEIVENYKKGKEQFNKIVDEYVENIYLPQILKRMGEFFSTERVKKENCDTLYFYINKERKKIKGGLSYEQKEEVLYRTLKLLETSEYGFKVEYSYITASYKISIPV